MNLEDQTIYTVSDLNAEARAIVEECFAEIWVMGEISNLVRPASGHFYFSLKDESAQIRCAFFRGAQRQLKFTPEHGQAILVRGQVSLYEPRGDYQLIVREMQLAGDGALQLAFAKLKAKLETEGLFDEARKKPIPELPQQIGVITSATGAAIRDILKVLKRRFHSIPVLIYPTLVQGNEAATQIVDAIKKANQQKACDVLILARGGGSLEDLWPFNEEIVAREIFNSQIPIVTGIGHEIDFTIADFVADLRAATPSAAAECVSPNKSDWLMDLVHYQQRLQQVMQRYLSHTRLELLSLQKQLRHPKQLLQQQAQQLDYFESQLTQLLKHCFEKKFGKIKEISAKLDALSPLNTLGRGFAIVEKAGEIIRNAKTLKKGDTVTTRLVKGRFTSTVITIDLP